jgi:hypothetical protein
LLLAEGIKGADSMKNIVFSVAAALAISVAAPAFAADMPAKAPKAAPAAAPSQWDIAFGAAIASDYNFRGISQSDRGPSGFAYFEPRFNITPDVQLYGGIAATSVKLATDPAAEVDLYGGIRPTFGPFAFDFGGIYYWYPRETQFCGTGIPPCLGNPAFPNTNTTLDDTDYWEVYGKVLWTVNPIVTLGANVYYSPSWLNTGASGTYASGTAKFTAPANFLPHDITMYVSGEAGYYWLGTTDFLPGIYTDTTGATGANLPDYAYWNVGIGFSWKVFTLDLRYHDTNLSKAECNLLTGDPGAVFTGPVAVGNATTFAASKWCNATFIAKLSADLTLGSLK